VFRFRVTKIYPILIAALIVGSMLAFLSIYIYTNQPHIPNGTTLSRWDISGLRIDQFRKQLLHRIQGIEQQKLELIASDTKSDQEAQLDSKQTSVSSTLLQFGMKTNAEEIIKQIESLAHAPMLQRAKIRWQLKDQKLELTFDLESDKLETVVDQHWKEQIETQSTNAQRIITANDRVKYIPEEVGLQIDMNDLRRDITNLIRDLFSNPPSKDKIVHLHTPLRTVHPEMTVESLAEEGIDRKIIEFTTFYRTSGEGRIHNIQSTAKTIHDRVMEPGEVFNYEEVIRKTEKDFGFKKAPVIINGKLVQGIGGGICQVSTTLYNAIIRSGLEIVERQNHSLPINYVPLGQDATFASGYINFKFRNSVDSHLLIRVETTKNQITVKLFGSLREGLSYEIDSQVVKVLTPPIKYVKNPQLPRGKTQTIQAGKAGYIVDTFRITKQDGKVVKKERISRDHYKAKPSLIAANPKDHHESKIPNTPNESKIPNESNEPNHNLAPKKQIIEDGVSGPVF
jgi:vancomycin resistance protein YoaR